MNANNYFTQTHNHVANVRQFSFVSPSSGNSKRPFLVSLATCTVFRRSFDRSGPQLCIRKPCFRILYPTIRSMKTGTCIAVSNQVPYSGSLIQIWGLELTLMYCATNSRLLKGFWRNALSPLNMTRITHIDSPYAALSHCPWDLYGYRG